MLGHQRQAIAFVGVIYRDDVDLGAQSRTSASHDHRIGHKRWAGTRFDSPQ